MNVNSKNIIKSQYQGKRTGEMTPKPGRTPHLSSNKQFAHLIRWHDNCLVWVMQFDIGIYFYDFALHPQRSTVCEIPVGSDNHSKLSHISNMSTIFITVLLLHLTIYSHSFVHNSFLTSSIVRSKSSTTNVLLMSDSDAASAYKSITISGFISKQSNKADSFVFSKIFEKVTA